MRTIVITGGTSGIGYAAATAILGSPLGDSADQGGRPGRTETGGNRGSREGGRGQDGGRASGPGQGGGSTNSGGEGGRGRGGGSRGSGGDSVGVQDGPWHVVVAGRDAARTREAVDRLAAAARPGHVVEAMELDLASLASVRAFAAELTARLTTADPGLAADSPGHLGAAERADSFSAGESTGGVGPTGGAGESTGRIRAGGPAAPVAGGALPPLAALVCNAGVQSGARLSRTADGFEMTFGVNHLGHFALVTELLPVLRAPSRVVVVTSDTHDPALKLGPDPAWTGARVLADADAASGTTLTDGQRRYCTSKLANIYFTYALARRLPAGVTANAFNPGMVLGTGLGRSLPAPARLAATHVMPRMTWLLRRVLSPNINSAEKSGGALAWLATDPSLAGTTGRYFDGRTEIRSSTESYDTARAEALWTDSLDLIAP